MPDTFRTLRGESDQEEAPVGGLAGIADQMPIGGLGQIADSFTPAPAPVPPAPSRFGIGGGSYDEAQASDYAEPHPDSDEGVNRRLLDMGIDPGLRGAAYTAAAARRSRWSATDDAGNPLPGAARITGGEELRRMNIMAGLHPSTQYPEYVAEQQREQMRERQAFSHGSAAYAEFLRTRAMQQIIRQQQVAQLGQQQPSTGGIGGAASGFAGALGGQQTTVDQEVANRVAAMRRTNPTGRINEAQIRHQVVSERRLQAAADQRGNRPQADEATLSRHLDHVQTQMNQEEGRILQLRSEERRANVSTANQTPFPDWMRDDEARSARRRQLMNQRLAMTGHALLPEPEANPLQRQPNEPIVDYTRRVMSHAADTAEAVRAAQVHVATNTQEGMQSAIQQYRTGLNALPESQRAVATRSIEAAERMIQQHGAPAEMTAEQRQEFSRHLTAIRDAFTSARAPVRPREPIRNTGPLGIQMPWDQRRMVTGQ